MKLVHIKCNGEMNDLDIPINLKNIKKKLIESSVDTGYKQIQQLYSWEYDDSIIMCYGWTTGIAGKENKHELPPNANKCNESLDNSDTQLLFGDQFILMKHKNKLCDLDVSDYSLFYSVCFEGFDDCLTDDDDDDDDDDDSERIRNSIEDNEIIISDVLPRYVRQFNRMIENDYTYNESEQILYLNVVPLDRRVEIIDEPYEGLYVETQDDEGNTFLRYDG